MNVNILLPVLAVLALPVSAGTQARVQESSASPATVSASAPGHAKVVRVFVEDLDDDQTGSLHIVYDDGVDVAVTLRPKSERATDDTDELQQGFTATELAEDKDTVGWAETYSSCCQSYPIPLVLTLYRSGKILQRIRQGQMLWSWMFVDGGARVAAVWGPTHGPEVGDFQLYDVASGRMLAEINGDEATQALLPDAPSWAQRLEKKLDGGK